jgi:Fe-S-cluster containining protein
MNTCSHCGACCTKINLGRVAQFREEQKEYMRAHGVVEDQGFFLVPFKCPHLKIHTVERVAHYSTKTGEKIPDEPFNQIDGFICDIHDNKPKICKEFDGSRYKNRKLFWVPSSCTMKGEKRA